MGWNRARFELLVASARSAAPNLRVLTASSGTRGRELQRHFDALDSELPHPSSPRIARTRAGSDIKGSRRPRATFRIADAGASALQPRGGPGARGSRQSCRKQRRLRSIAPPLEIASTPAGIVEEHDPSVSTLRRSPPGEGIRLRIFNESVIVAARVRSRARSSIGDMSDRARSGRRRALRAGVSVWPHPPPRPDSPPATKPVSRSRAPQRRSISALLHAAMPRAAFSLGLARLGVWGGSSS